MVPIVEEACSHLVSDASLGVDYFGSIILGLGAGLTCIYVPVQGQGFTSCEYEYGCQRLDLTGQTTVLFIFSLRETSLLSPTRLDFSNTVMSTKPSFESS